MTEINGPAAAGRADPLPRNVWVVTATSFLTDVSSEMLATVVPLFMANVLGAPTAIIGLVEGLAETTASVTKLFSGWLSDRLGQRKSLTVAGYGLSTAAKGLLVLASSWGWVLASRFGDRLGKGIRTSPRDALIADSVAPGQRGRAFGLHRAGDTAGAVGGLAAALVVVWWTSQDAARLTRPTFQLLAALSLIPATLAVLVLALGARETPRPQEKRAAPRLSLAPFDARFRYFLGVMVVFTLGNSSDAFLVLRAQSVGLPLPGLLGMMSTFNLVYSLLAGPAGAVSDRIDRRRLMIVGWLLYALVYLGFAAVTAGWQAWALMAAYGVYYALTEGVARALVADLVPGELRGTAYGVFNFFVGLMAFPASFLAGLLWQGAAGWAGFGPGAPFYFGASLALAAAGLLVVMPRPRPAA